MFHCVIYSQLLLSSFPDAFCKSTSHIPVNIPHPTSHILHLQHSTPGTFHIPNILHPQHPTSQTSHISNIPHPQHPSFPTSHIPGIPHPHHCTSPTSNIPNTTQTQHPTFPTYCITNIPHNLNFIITFNKFLNTCQLVFNPISASVALI